MQFIREIKRLSQKISSCALTIGNFDGVHLAHQALISELVKIAKARHIPSVVMTFEPHPTEFFTGKPCVRLMSFRDKYQRLKELGLDYLLCIRFNREFSQVSAEDFVENILLKELSMKVVVIGDDFRFGANRSGDVNLLKKMSSPKGFTLVQLPALEIEGERVGSTRIRQALSKGDLALAQKLLGHPFSISGRVCHGDKRGREFGYPTANIALPRENPAINGIFAAEVKGLSDKSMRAVASLGTRPMFEGKHYVLEVNIFNFSQDIYGRLIEVEFLEKLRDEKKFDSVEELIQQMHEDARMAGRI